MNALAQSAAPPAHVAAVPLLRTLALCDLVDSTALVERLGDQRAAELFRKHDRLTRALLQTHGGREIDKTDGFLVMFDRPIQAVTFALDYQRGLKELALNEQCPMSARVGIHVGDILTWDNAPDDIAKGAKLIEVEGLVKPIASRLMQLALPSQILMSGVAYALSHRSQGELAERLSLVRWRTHGRYRFKGIPDPIPVFEVGEEGMAPLRPPPWSGKAHREVPFWRRPATMVIEALVLAAVVAIPIIYVLRPEPAIAFANRDWVVVGDLKNLTGDASFDESLAMAFRIGLEQSRYVNVLSDLKTRETVKLMQQDPEKTAVDRAVGSEIAIRDGARALILPTVAEIGGRVRVTAEVIDPSTQTTVYSESADGVGEASVLPSLDKVNQQLRVRLGEALATVTSESQPLERVTTGNLDALKAYSLAERTYATGNMGDARALYMQAVATDPEFALAHIGLAKIAFNADHEEDASREIATAIGMSARLLPRDKLYAEALQATSRNPRLSMEKWRLLTTLYPGRFEGIYGFFAWQSGNRFSDAVAALEKSISPQNPYRGTSQYVLGALYLGVERYADAIHQFDEATRSGVVTQNEYSALAYATTRDYKTAARLIAEGRQRADSSRDLGAEIGNIAIALDQGKWAEALAIIDSAQRRKPELDAANMQLMSAMELSVRPLVGSRSEIAERRAFDGLVSADPKDGDDTDHEFNRSLAAYLAARAGRIEVARAALAGLGPQSRSGDFPILSNMRIVAEAELARVNGQAKEAELKLQPLMDGNELYVTHVARMDALADIHDFKAAATEARWLSSNRGRAYAEYNSRRVLTPFNVAQSNLALLRSAEFLDRTGEKSDGARALVAFRTAWPAADHLPGLSARMRKLGTTQ